MKYDYFGVPTQVKFWDWVEKKYIGGTAYRDKIICGCCSVVFDIDKIYAFAPSEIKNPIIECDDWADIGYEICGDDN